MRTVTGVSRPLAVGAATSLLWGLGAGAAGAADVDVAASTGSTTSVEAAAVVAASVRGPKITLRPTTLGPVEHDGQLLPSADHTADTVLRAAVELTAHTTSSAAVDVEVQTEEGQPVVRLHRDPVTGCDDLAVAFTAVVTVSPQVGDSDGDVLLTADVAVSAGEDAKATARVELALPPDRPETGQRHEVPVATGVELCHAEVVGEVSATVTAATEAVLAGEGGTQP